jgi:uncharacterized phiE125 gp8 family phage protein
MKYLIATAPTTEPVTIADARIYIRAITGDTTEDAAIIEPLITAAREYCENVTGRAMAAQTIEAYPEGFESIMKLPRPPLVSITSIKYTNDEGTETTMSATNYLTDTVGGRVAIKVIPSFTPALVNPIKITYAAGYTASPKLLRQAMLLLIGHWYTNREAVVVGAFASVEVKMAVDAMLKQYKVWWF